MNNFNKHDINGKYGHKVSNSLTKKGKTKFGNFYYTRCKEKNLFPSNIILNQFLEKYHALILPIEKPKADLEWDIIIASLNSKENDLKTIAILTTDKGEGSNESIRMKNEKDSIFKLSEYEKKTASLNEHFYTRLLNSVVNYMCNEHHLSILELCGLPLTMTHIQLLAKGLQNSNSLKILSLSRTIIKDEGLKILALSLKNSVSIMELHFAGCELTHESAFILTDLIKFQCLRREAEQWSNTLRPNYINTNSHAELFGIPLNLKANSIKRLNICNNEIGDIGMNSLLEIITEDLGLEALDVQFNSITNEGLKDIDFLIKLNRSLTIFDLRNNFIDDETMEKIDKFLKRNKELRSNQGSSTNNKEFKMLDGINPLSFSYHTKEIKITSNSDPTCKKLRSRHFPSVNPLLDKTKKKWSTFGPMKTNNYNSNKSLNSNKSKSINKKNSKSSSISKVSSNAKIIYSNNVDDIDSTTTPKKLNSSKKKSITKLNKPKKGKKKFRLACIDDEISEDYNNIPNNKDNSFNDNTIHIPVTETNFENNTIENINNEDDFDKQENDQENENDADHLNTSKDKLNIEEIDNIESDVETESINSELINNTIRNQFLDNYDEDQLEKMKQALTIKHKKLMNISNDKIKSHHDSQDVIEEENNSNNNDYDDIDNGNDNDNILSETPINDRNENNDINDKENNSLLNKKSINSNENINNNDQKIVDEEVRMMEKELLHSQNDASIKNKNSPNDNISNYNVIDDSDIDNNNNNKIDGHNDNNNFIGNLSVFKINSEEKSNSEINCILTDISSNNINFSANNNKSDGNSNNNNSSYNESYLINKSNKIIEKSLELTEKINKTKENNIESEKDESSQSKSKNLNKKSLSKSSHEDYKNSFNEDDNNSNKDIHESHSKKIKSNRNIKNKLKNSNKKILKESGSPASKYTNSNSEDISTTNNITYSYINIPGNTNIDINNPSCDETNNKNKYDDTNDKSLIKSDKEDNTDQKTELKSKENVINNNDNNTNIYIDFGNEGDYLLPGNKTKSKKKKELIYNTLNSLSEISDTIDTIENNLKSFNVEVINPPSDMKPKLLLPKAKSDGMINEYEMFSNLIINSDEDIQYIILSITNSLRDIQSQTIQEILESSHFLQPIVKSLKFIVTYSKYLLKILNIFIEKKKEKMEKEKLVKTRSDSNIAKKSKNIIGHINGKQDPHHPSYGDKKKINFKNLKIGKDENTKCKNGTKKQKEEIKSYQIEKYKFYKSQINVLLEVMECMINSYYTYMEKIEEKEEEN